MERRKVTMTPTTLTAIRVPAWAWAFAAIALFAVFMMMQENGSLIGATQGQLLHELTHDARHTLGVPCH
jgi:hypothetical protein